MSLEKRDLYRLPWSKNDNAIAWLEVTDICNLHCEGCYRQRLTGHKPVDQVKDEIRFFKRWRNPDNVSIAGGEPLVHPNIVEIVALIAENGMKPVILTNAARLTPEFLHELKQAGLAGFTIHIDSHQGRPEWQGKNEAEHNELREHYARMIAAEGGLITVFNSTVYPSTFHEIPAVVRWGRAHIDIVHGLVFITYRIFDTGATAGFDASGEQVDASRLSYSTGSFEEQFVTSPEVYGIIKDNFPDYQPSCYLGGTVRHDSYKWLIGGTIGSGRAIYGSVGARSMQAAQAGHHLLRGTYLAYLAQMRAAPLLFLLAPWDKAVWQALKSRVSDVLRHPVRLFDRIHVQTIGIIQAPDLQASGQVDMCDSCPDMTVWNGTLINSCRMDEYRLFGGMLSLNEKAQATPAGPGALPGPAAPGQEE